MENMTRRLVDGQIHTGPPRRHGPLRCAVGLADPGGGQSGHGEYNSLCGQNDSAQASRLDGLSNEYKIFVCSSQESPGVYILGPSITLPCSLVLCPAPPPTFHLAYVYVVPERLKHECSSLSGCTYISTVGARRSRRFLVRGGLVWVLEPIIYVISSRPIMNKR